MRFDIRLERMHRIDAERFDVQTFVDDRVREHRFGVCLAAQNSIRLRARPIGHARLQMHGDETTHRKLSRALVIRFFATTTAS